MENQLTIQIQGKEKKVDLPAFGKVTVVMINGKVKHIKCDQNN